MKTLVLVPVLLVFSLSPIFAAEKLPNDVRHFMAQLDACDHFRGELPDPEEAERMREVTGQIEKRWRGTDRRLRLLRKKYGSDASVKKRLNVYDEQIEPRANQH